ncbi:hypothetical protein LSAT2_015206 [Lamellibrachia satsuma]|nr:hypothetical protein LSAT2_015206 [Lamellibrachia satsuma]
MNCKYFTPFLDNTKAQAVREVRNCVMHTSTMKVTTAKLSTYMTKMIDLLQDSRYLLTYPVAKQAVLEIKQIQTTPIDVRDAAFIVNERQAWRHALSAADAQHKQDILNLVASDSALEARLQAEIAEVKRSLEGLDEVMLMELRKILYSGHNLLQDPVQEYIND